MADKNQLGMFWDGDTLNFVESSATRPKKTFNIAYEAAKPETPSKKNALDPWERELAANIKQALQKEKMPASRVNLSLPTKDIIFRSFVIPWMVPSEIKNVVGFEVSKYIPFSLDKLSYSYHPIVINLNGKRQIQIIFVAIKKNVLENYTKILKAATLCVDTIEPAASSLIRALSLKQLIPKDETVALIEKGDIGRIIIIDKDIPQFVREFRLGASSTEEEVSDAESEVKKLTKEVRISLDYFNRQNEQLRVEKIFFLMPSSEQELPQKLEKFLDIPVVAIPEESVLENMPEAGVGVLNAYGASIIQTTESEILFDFSGHNQQSEALLNRKPISFVPFDYKRSLKAALICIPIIIISIGTSMLLTQNLKKEISAFNQALGPFQDSDVSFIEQKDDMLSTKIEDYKKVRIKSDVAQFLLLIPNLLPEGAWLSNLDIAYDDSAASIKPNTSTSGRIRSRSTANKKDNPALKMTIDGYAYSNNKNQQFRIVNQFLRTIKSDTELSTFFQSMALEETSDQKLDGNNVTYFKIVCKQTK